MDRRRAKVGELHQMVELVSISTYVCRNWNCFLISHLYLIPHTKVIIRINVSLLNRTLPVRSIRMLPLAPSALNTSPSQAEAAIRSDLDMNAISEILLS